MTFVIFFFSALSKKAVLEYFWGVLRGGRRCSLDLKRKICRWITFDLCKQRFLTMCTSQLEVHWSQPVIELNLPWCASSAIKKREPAVCSDCDYTDKVSILHALQIKQSKLPNSSLYCIFQRRRCPYDQAILICPSQLNPTLCWRGDGCCHLLRPVW